MIPGLRPMVVVESPFAGDVARNMRYLRACLRDSIDRGEAPFASHRMYTDVLDDAIPAEREIGIACGFSWGVWAPLRAFYVDLGYSSGMRQALEHAEEIEQAIVERRLPEDVLAEVLTGHQGILI